jgi:hypothetical protein
MRCGPGERAWDTLGGASGLTVRVVVTGWGSVVLRGATTAGTLGGGAVGAVSGVAVTEKMSDNCLMAAICLSAIAASGDAGDGFLMAQHSSMAALMAASADESCGILPKCGKNSTVRAMRSALVFVAYTL